MQCPRCGKRPLCACYDPMPYYPPLGSHQEARIQPVLVHLSCEHCSSLWYAFPGETSEVAYNRVQKEELHP